MDQSEGSMKREIPSAIFNKLIYQPATLYQIKDGKEHPKGQYEMHVKYSIK